MNTITIFASTITILVLSSCGQAPADTPKQSVSTAVAAAPSQAPVLPVQSDTINACGMTFTVSGDQVLLDQVVVPDGSYTVGGYMEGPMYIPPCGYIVNNGSVCTQGNCGNKNGGWS